MTSAAGPAVPPRLPIVVEPRKRIIQPSPGFAKKHLSDFHVELAALCGFGCAYCSSNTGYYLRVNAQKFAAATAAQTGGTFDPKTNPNLFLMYEDVVGDLERELATKPRDYGAGKTLMFSQLTDPFSPELVERGITLAALRLLLDRTSFRIRILTKGDPAGREFMALYRRYRDRVVIGLSIGTVDHHWAARVEKGTLSPPARAAIHNVLQDQGFATYMMLCPVFPSQVRFVPGMTELLRADRVEHVWCEPYNDRINWRHVQSSLLADSTDRVWLEEVFANGRHDLWSDYAAGLYEAVVGAATRDGWTDKLRFLLYEDRVTAADAPRFGNLEGVLLQGKPGSDGLSKNPAIACRQKGRAAG